MKRQLEEISQDEGDAKTSTPAPAQHKSKDAFAHGEDANEEVTLVGTVEEKKAQEAAEQKVTTEQDKETTTTTSTEEEKKVETKDDAKDAAPAAATTTTSAFSFGNNTFSSFGSGFSSFTSQNPFDKFNKDAESKPAGFGNFGTFSYSAFGSSSTPATDAAPQPLGGDDEEDGQVDTSAHEDPAVASTLQKFEEQLGEDGEELVYSNDKAKIFELTWVVEQQEPGAHQPKFGSTDADIEKTTTEKVEPKKIQKYVERGNGEIHLNVITKDTKKSCRIVTRHIPKGSLLINEFVYPTTTTAVVLDPAKLIRFSTIGVEGDSPTPVAKTYLLRFADADQAKEFVNALEKAKAQLA